MTTTASLAALNDDILAGGGEAVPMNRFRPNVVVENDRPWGEDGWAAIQIGDVVLDFAKPCVRCSVTTVEQDCGVRPSDEPLATLRRTRKSGDARVPGFLFGWNAVPRGQGRLSVGAPVSVVEEREPWPIGGSAHDRQLPF